MRSPSSCRPRRGAPMESSLPLTTLAQRASRLGRAHTKIVATIGPASEERLGELVDAGMSVARINLSHGSTADHRRRVERLRAVAAERGAPLGILVDIRGPKLRLGLFPGGKLVLAPGERLR